MAYTFHTKHTPSGWAHTGRLVSILFLLLPLFTACGSEDALEADFVNPSDHFQPVAEDNSDEAELRRQFFAETGSYLLFNDTIQRQSLGKDINGEERYFVETLDLTYSVGLSSYISTHYAYTYLETFEQKQQAADFLRQYILPHLTGSLRPYSWFVSNVISSWTDTNSTPSKPYAVNNQRCIAIAANYLIQRERTDAQKTQYAQRILNVTIGQLAQNNSEAFTEFYSFSEAYYGRDYVSFGFEGKPSTHELRNIGFLSSTSAGSFPSATTDLYSYSQLVIQNTEEQLAKTYANYPIVLQKAAVVRKVLTELGYVF